MRKILAISFIAISVLSAQDTDSTIVFSSPNKDIIPKEKSEMNEAWGIDILLSNNGFGLAGFYRHKFDRDLSGTVTLGVADSKDANEVEYTDYFGQTYVPGKINRFLVVPLMFGVQYRLFADDIMDSFRPYVNAGIGPSLILASPYAKEWFSSWSYARSYYTAGGFIGLGAFFGSDMGSLAGVNIRYYFLPYSGGITSLQDPLPDGSPGGPIRKKSDFGGFFITINLGSAF